MYRIHIGCELSYAAPAAIPGAFVLQPPAHPRQRIEHEALRLAGAAAAAFATQYGGARLTGFRVWADRRPRAKRPRSTRRSRRPELG